jgi:hypothetical protein
MAIAETPRISHRIHDLLWNPFRSSIPSLAREEEKRAGILKLPALILIPLLPWKNLSLDYAHGNELYHLLADSRVMNHIHYLGNILIGLGYFLDYGGPSR